MAWDGGAETHGTEQGYMLTVHVWVVNRDLCLEHKGTQMPSESSLEFNNYIH